MRIALGSLMGESNTFAPELTTRDTFAATYLHHGEAVLGELGRARVEVGGFLAVLRAAGAEAVPLLAAHAGSGGPVRRPDFDELVEDMARRLRAAGPVDGLLLALHGAMVVEDAPDAEAEIIARLRAVLPQGTPVGVSLDLHGHITPAMLQPDTVLIGYREYPHTDLFETGERVAQLVLHMVRTGARPAMALAKAPMLLSPLAARSDGGPLRLLLDQARALEASGAITHASLFPVQPWLDVPGLGFAALVCADTRQAAQTAADALAGVAWAMRDRFEPSLVPLEQAVRIGLAGPGLTVIGDGGDAPSSGAAGDDPAVLDTLLRCGADTADRLSYVTLVDAPAARQAAAAGIGATLTLSVGHTRSRGTPRPITATVLTLASGDYTLHDPGAKGSKGRMGLACVLGIGSIRLAVRTHPCYEWDTGIYTALGLDLRDAGLIAVKSPSHFRVAYGPHADRILTADTPGAACGNMRRLVFQAVTRPLYPLDPMEDDHAEHHRAVA